MNRLLQQVTFTLVGNTFQTLGKIAFTDKNMCFK